ncbi:MAG: transcriptional regulator [Hormoscilla sp. GUM202]|nr:transcriptional regulator [Hormoscilla sp. GM7CHS1pb]MBO1346353.1 transcriptional regulator [Hormoscilla sp. GUM202]
MPSVSYHPYKISTLKDPKYAAVYLTTILEAEEGDLELGLLKLALRDVFKALGEPNMSPTSAKRHLEKLEDLLSKPGNAAIFSLADWLTAIGLKLNVTVNEDDEERENSDCVLRERYSHYPEDTAK